MQKEVFLAAMHKSVSHIFIWFSYSIFTCFTTTAAMLLPLPLLCSKNFAMTHKNLENLEHFLAITAQ